MQFMEENFTNENGIEEVDAESNFSAQNPQLKENLLNCCPKLAEFSRNLMQLKWKFEALVDYTGMSQSKIEIFGSQNSEQESSYKRSSQDLNYTGNVETLHDQYAQHKKMLSFDKENENTFNEYGEESKDFRVPKSGNSSLIKKGQIYYSGKANQDNSLEFRGAQKLRTSIKDKAGRDLGNLGIDNIDRSSVGSPVSYQSDQLAGEFQEVRYYQPQDSRGNSTLQRHVYS